MIIAFSGPSGIGKGYVKERLLTHYPQIEEIAWLTTRPLRANELTASNRVSVSNEVFEKLRDSGQLSLVQGVFGHYYGVRGSDLLLAKGIRLTELHPYVVGEALQVNPRIVLIGMTTPDLELLHERLSLVRRTDTPEEIVKRVAAAELEMGAILDKRSFYRAIVEVTKQNEGEVFEQILTILEPILNERGTEKCYKPKLEV